MTGGWLDKNSYHHSRFSNLAALIRAKQSLGVSVSVGLPCFNEESTIGQGIRAIMSELVYNYPLVDEIAVIDGGSTDRTMEIARDEGVDVYVSDQCLPRMGSSPGKGDNLWKSLFVLKGDIIVWLDADIKNMHPKFVYGLVGPLLCQPNIKFVKAYYERPLHRPGEDDEYGGGRVTEVLVRPLFSAFFPELAELYQPCSGECAGRRELLELLPFAAGYGIETGMLIDIVSRFGRDVIAQVNLDKRVHRNQSTTALGKMGFEIIHAFLSRLEALNKANFNQELYELYYKLSCGPSLYRLEETSVQLNERPPMCTVPEYRQMRGLPG